MSQERTRRTHEQLNHTPKHQASKQKRRQRHELNKQQKEHRYASMFLPFQPTEYELIFINRTTTIGTLNDINHRINQSNIFTML
jgi:hypothetical protein